MIVQSILLILPVLFASFAAMFPQPVAYEAQSTIKFISPDERRKLGLFPKSDKKFVITENPTDSEVKLSSEEKGIIRTLMPKIIIKDKDKESEKYFIYRPPVTRRPLMKYKKFTVEPTNAIKVNYAIYKNMKRIPYQDSSDISKENQDDFLEFNDEHSSELENFKSDGNDVQESVEGNDFTTESEFADVSENNRLKRDNIKADNLNSEEKEDLKEYIFVNNIIPSLESEDKFTSSHKVFKRAVNIIEEENFGTTIAVFKFTGRATYLTNDLNYKNINS